ncbi:sigma 54-interacting transcriptional regulator [Candidatus Sumerlaeota bacterium]|nr:sigma 54-interacting transcriptional regulator [Candidatus Sumerlaeota bacterium]
MPYLVLQKGESKASVFPLTKRTTTIGRGDTSDIVLEDKNISRIHAQVIRLDRDLTSLVDLGSSNGSYVNDLPINRIFLMDGDEIKMGETILLFREGESETDHLEPAQRRVRIEKRALLAAHPMGQPTEIFTKPVEDQGESLKNAHLQLRTIYKLITDLNTIKDLTNIYQRVGQVLLVSLGMDRIVFFSYDRIQGRFNPELSMINPAINIKSFDETYPVHQQALYCIEKERFPYLFTEEDMDDDTSSSSVKPMIMGIPILFERDLLGMMYMDNPHTRKPFDKINLDFVSSIANHIGVIQRNLNQYRTMEEKNASLEKVIQENLVIVCRDPKMMEIMDILNHLAETDANVLIRGESGAGKELIARAIHYYSNRRSAPLVCINCASLPETLIESELFGYERGAFTGAISRKPGKFETANGGTVFLDEIGDISLSAQAKILRILQEGELQRVGGVKTLKVDLRIIAATNKNLEEAIKNREFREDLYYRLRVVEIDIPPLRERPEDIPLLAEYFLRTLRAKTSSPVQRISPETKKILLDYRWPGNVRELRNVMERAIVFARGEEILPEHLPSELSKREDRKKEDDEIAPVSLAEMEERHIRKILGMTSGNKFRAAEILGISRSTLYEKLKQYGIGTS